MAGELVLDTGALVSLLDRSRKHHERFAAFFESWSRPVVSTEAVLTEATHLLAHVQRGRRACLDFFLFGGAVLVPVTRASLRRSRELVDRVCEIFREARPAMGSVSRRRGRARSGETLARHGRAMTCCSRP